MRPASADGKALADATVTDKPQTITGDSDWFEIFGYSEACVADPHDLFPLLPSPPLSPLPGVAVSAAPVGEPWVIVSEGMQTWSAITFNLPGQFIERFRVHDTARAAASGPVVLPDWHSATGAYDGNNAFSGLNGAKLKDVNMPGGVLGTPSRTANGEIVAVGYNLKRMIAILGVQPLIQAMRAA